MLAATVSGAVAQGGGGNFIIDAPSPAPASKGLDPDKKLPPPAVAAPAAAPARVDPLFAKPMRNLAPVEGEGDGPDETALRYYASQNQTARVKTEIARLRRLYPDWNPPENLYDAVKVSGEDEQQYWDLYEAGRMDELRAALEARQRDEPGWAPSADLASKVRGKIMRASIMALWQSGKLADLTEFVKSHGFGGDDADVDVLWTVAESYARTKQSAEALAIFAKILADNKDPGQRLATIQKAMSCMRMTDVEKLLAMGKTSASGKWEFAPIAIDITRARISAFLHEERAEEVAPDELKAFEAYARPATDPNQPGLIAWYYYKTKSFRAALDWFKLALEHGGDAMIAHGLAHSLRELGMYRETEEVSYAWREPLINNAILFIDILERDLTKEIPPYIEPERLRRYAQVTMDLASGEGAQGLAWYAYNTCQFNVAYEWFQRANAWLPKEATAYGLALSARKLGKTRDFVEIVNRYDGLFPKVVELVFPDNLYHPPTPCDLLNASEKDRQRLLAGQPNGPLAPIPAPMPAESSYVAARQAGYLTPQTAAPAAVALRPSGPPVAYPARPDQMPKINLAEFPVSVPPENLLRFAGTQKMASAPAPMGRLRVAIDSGAAAEPWRGAQPMVATRVPGVGPMPYERYGFSLLPGWTGVLAASAPHNAQAAPAGTLWTTLQADDAQATRGGAYGIDAMRQDPMEMMAKIAALPRVPPPEDFKAAPTGQSMDPSPGKPQAMTASIMTMATLAAPQAPISQPSPPSAPVAGMDDAARRAVQLYKDGDYAGAIAALDGRPGVDNEPTDLRLVRAWSLMHLNRGEEARAIFAQLDRAKVGVTKPAPNKPLAAKAAPEPPKRPGAGFAPSAKAAARNAAAVSPPPPAHPRPAAPSGIY